MIDEFHGSTLVIENEEWGIRNRFSVWLIQQLGWSVADTAAGLEWRGSQDHESPTDGMNMYIVHAWYRTCHNNLFFWYSFTLFKITLYRFFYILILSASTLGVL